MVKLRRASPVIDMAGLARFEKRCGVSAPGFIEHLVQAGTEQPDAPLAAPDVEILAVLIASCLPGEIWALRRAKRLLRRAPARVATALRAFLEDPLPIKQAASEGHVDPDVAPPSVLDMRAAWLAGGRDPAVFDRLTLWEHSRILHHLDKQKRSDLVDAAVAARVSQAKDDQFRRFVSETLGTNRGKTSRDWVRHLFSATAHLPKMTQQELAQMKGQA